MLNLSLEELRAIAKIRDIKDNKSMSIEKSPSIVHKLGQVKKLKLLEI